MLEPAFSLPSLAEAERKQLLSQRKKAYSLIFLMIMLAQTSYIGALEGWSLYTELEEEHEEPLRVDSPTVCAATSRSSGTAIHVDVTEGDDAYPGTTNCPKASLGAAVTLATSEAASNPEIVLHAGLYHENVSINNLDNLLIRAADGDRVVFDGTRSISDDLGGVWGSADSDGIQEVTLTEDGWQLFLAHEEQVPARWPNAGFDDETVFNRSYWAEGILTNSNNAYTKGWLTDAGPEAGVHTGLNETVNASGLDPVGAIAVMNLGSFRSNSRIITDWNPNNGTFAYDADGVGWKTKHHAYFLEGKRELIDVDGEWWYNNTNNRLHYKTPSGQDANDLDLRVKVQPFAISVDGSDGVTIQGIDFFGTTVNFNNCDGCSFTNATLEYPSTSKRSLGIAGESEDDRWMTRFYRSKNSFVDNISITNTDGGAIEFQGSPGQSNNNTINNSYFHAIDWSAADQKGLMVTIYEGGRDMYFTNNSVHLTGASSVLSIGDAPKVFYNEVWDVGHLQTDGAVVQVMQGEAPGSIIAYNWIHDIIKYGARFDAPIGQAGEGRNGTMHHNVIWNAAGGLMVKGDYHDIHNNTVFNSTGKNDMIILTDGGVNNGNSTIHQNAADKMADHRTDSWSLYPLPAGTYWNNWNGYVNTTDSVWNQLVDPANRDFRPKVNSHLSNMSAGAYDAGVSNPWTAGISWTYTTPNAPVTGCMLDYADNYNAEATLSDGSCLFASYSPPSTLDLRLHLDPTNSSSYSGSGTDLVDLSTYGNDGTIDGAEWEANRTRFYYDGSCSGATAPPNQAGTYVCDEVTFAETNDHDPDANGDWSVSVWINATTVQHSVIIGKWNGGGSASDLGYIIRIGSDNKLYTSVGTTSGSSAVSTPRISIDEDRWYHLVMVADVGNILRLYADGVNVANASLLGSGSIRNTTSGISIGSYNAGEYNQPFDGNIGEVMIFADALNSTTINQMYNAGKGVYSNTTNLSYAQTSSTMLLGQTYSFPVTATNGELTTSYSLTGTLPTGMNFESSNGTIWGTPTVAMTSTTYTLTANNSAGSYSTSISLTSQHVAPYDLVYSPENMMFTKGTAITPNFPSVSGGTVTSWEISPSLPTGLTWGTTDGKISGTPTALQTIATTYTIWANNSGGSASAQVNITINDEAPDISYSPDWFDLTNNTAMSPTTPTNSGGAIPSAVISSASNPGYKTSIAVDSYGYKHISWSGNSGFLKYATDASGSWVGQIVDTSSATGYHSSIAIDSNDGVHISYFDNSNDDLKYATCSSGCTTASNWNYVSVDTSGDVGYNTSIALDSNDGVHISYFDNSNDDLKYATCSSGCTTASNWNEVSVDTTGNVGLFNSIAIDSNDGVHISYYDDTNYDLKYATCSSSCTTASNWDKVAVDTTGFVGSHTSIAIDSNDGLHISYWASTPALKYATCSSSCTTASNWDKVAIDTTGDVGRFNSIAIDSNDGVHISYHDYTNNDLKYATCSSGCTTASNWNNETVHSIGQTGYYTSIAIDANDVIHISYYDDTNNKIKYLALDSSSNTLGYSISPDLPEGLTLDPISGEISGTPTELSTNTTYTITVRNSGGVNTTTITILVNDQVPNALGYTPENMTLEKGTTMTTNTPSVSGGAVTSWEISPSLPTGLSFGTTNGSIWGTPTILQTTTVAYTIWANNSGGSESAQVNITINDQIASISYSSPVGISNNRLLSTITPTSSGGAVTSWEISPSLPTGLSFGTTNGSIWGTPENVTSNVTYTIYANNSGGSVSATLTLNMNWTLTPSADGAYITRNSSIGTDITWEWDYDPIRADNLTMYASWRNTCAIRDDGDVYCWGRNGNGQIGNGNMGNSHWKDRPTKTNNLGSDAISVSMGEQHTCALLDTGVLRCWGRNNQGQIGNGGGGDVSSPYAVALGFGRTATSVHLGYHHTCAILDDQSVKCWGRNQDGELGVGSTTSSFNEPQSINSLGTNRHAISLALGEGFTCALLDDGSIKCWGQDNFGQRGDGGGTGSDIRSPPSSAISLPAGRTATQISAGQFHVCALLDDASVVCWGKNSEGQLGDGTTTHRTAPVTTSSFGSGHSASHISAGYDHTCALLTDGGVRCWGSNNNGQLGDGTSTDRTSPPSSDINLGSGYTAIGISAGGGHTCAMLNDGDMKCWGARGSGQLGDDSNFASGDQLTPVFVHGNRVWEEGDFLTSPDVSGATCGISPALPIGMSLTSGTCAITGTPTVTAVNATYTVWANISGQSFSGQVWLEVGLNAPILSYSPTSYTYTKDSAISPVIPTNTGGEIASWELEGGLLPAGLNFGTSNGTFWGTPTAIVSASTYTVWANNSAGSDSFSITFTVNDVAPSITFTPSMLTLVTGSAMTSVTASNSGGSIVSCSVSPSLPSGLSLSSSCVLSGTPTVASSTASYTITATNTGGSDTATFSLTVQASGGSLTITPTNREGSVNSAIADITMSYTHTASNYGWMSGVSNTTASLATNFDYGDGVHWLGADSGEQGELVVIYARKDSTTTTHSLAMLYRWNGTWTETILDNGTNTGHHPSVAIDRQGAIHIAYIDDDNDKLRYATNASGSWVFATLGNSTIDSHGGRGTAIVVHPITDVVHIVTTNYEDSARTLQYHTNEGGSWVNETITDTTKDEGHDPAMAMDGDGNLHVAYYCDDGCEDLRLSSRIDGVWQNETVSSSGNIGNDPDIAIDSQGTIHIVSQYFNNKTIFLHSGTPSNWTEQIGLSGGSAYWPVVEVDSNDAVHISYHYASTHKDVMYMTNVSGSWSTPSKVEEYGGWGSEMVIDANDDIFIPNIHAGSNGVSHDDELQLTTVQGSGQGLTARPLYDISPMLPDGLVLNWRNGTISGTPTQALANTSFTVTVTALGATTTGTFTLFITGEPGILAYNDIQASNQTVITTATPSFTNNSTSGTATSWAISPTLPNGLSFGTTNGSIWGTPTLEQIKTSYTVWANNTAGSSSTTINITIGPAAPGPFEYSPENNTWTNNTEVHLSPVFVNRTTGNGSTWQVADINSGTSSSHSAPGQNMNILVGDTIYFDAFEAATGTELWAYDTSNQSLWRVTDIRSGSAGSNPGDFSSILVGDTLYFSANDGSTGHELWAYNTSNGTTWQVANIRSGSSHSNPGSNMMHVVNGVLYFNAHDGSKGMELWKHDPSTGATSRVYDINAGSTGSSVGKWISMVVGDVLYFSATDGSTGQELWAYNTSNSSDPWRVMDINSGSTGSEPGKHMSVLVGDTIYFDAGATGGRELWAHNISNHSTWRVVDIYSGSIGSNPGDWMALLVGDTIYFDADDGSTGAELWAHDTSNHSTWRVTDINSGSSSSGPGNYMSILVGDTVYFSAFTGSSGHELWAHDTSNHSTWQVAEINGWITMGGGLGSNPGQYMAVSVGDTIYLSAAVEQQGTELWAHDTSNSSTWRVADIYSGVNSGAPGYWMEILVGDTLYFSANDGSTGHELWAHRPSLIDYNTNTGGAVASWAINNTNLPTGLTFSTSNGTIYGTPTQLWTQTSYMVWANNSGGSTVAYLNITVVDEVPTLSYSPSTLVLTKGNQSSDLPLNATLTGPGAITSWEINATLPSGLNLGTSNGTIWGIPTVLQTTAVTYTIWANNSGGSTSATLNITIIDVAPGTFEYNPENNTFTNNTAESIAPTVTNSAGVITSWEINASLPSGLTIGASNGTIYGTPTELWTQKSYMVWANNSGGSSVGYLNITVVDEVPILSYSPNPLTLRNNTVSSDLPLVPILTGSGEILSWEINASLPSGVSFGTNNGTIYGTATELWNQTTYIVWGNNTGGSAIAYLNITVVDQVPTLSYSPSTLVLTKGNQSSDLPLNATLAGPGVITSWEISPTLPTGLNFGTDNGTIWGIATVLQTTATTYTIWANNSGGSSSASVTITINDVAPGTFEYNPENNTFTNNTAASIAPTVNNSAGVITSWAINATLPSGLVIGATNGTIYGTPTELWTQKSYMVWANNSGGSSVGYLNITVVDQVPSLSYSPSALVLTINAQSTELPLNATLTGPGAIVSWEMNASLPSGLSFGTTNGTIWGIPTVMQTTAVTYTVWGNNTGGSTSATVTITINDAVPGPFEYDPENNTWANDSLINLAPDFINYVNGNGSTWLVTDITSGISGLGPGAYFEVLIGDTIYFDADDGTDGSELWAHDTSNHSTWQVADIYSGSSDSSPGSGLYIVVDGVLYFSANDGVKGSELWAHNPANASTWRVADINSNSAFGSSPTVVDGKPSLVGDTFYFSATDGNTGRELWAHDTSNHSTWRVTDINSGSGNTNPGSLMQLLVGDTIYFNADDGSSGIELWAHDTSNISTWQVADVHNGQGNSESGKYMSILVEDTIYFDANDGNSGVELWAHNISNMTTWQTADIYGGGTSSYSGEYMSLLVGDTLYFSAGNGSTGQELWAHDASNDSTWLVADIHSSGDSDPGQFMAHVVGDTLYFSADDGNIGEELWAHDTSNHSTWLVSDILGYDPISFVNSGSRPGQHFSMVIDDIIYFSACNGCSTGNELYAYNTSNYTTWLDQEIAAGSASSTPGNGLNILVGDTLYLNTYTVATGRELWAYQPSSINIQTNTGGTVLSWAINGTLPSGLSFGTNNGTIYGRVTELWTQTSYMVWANNSGGSTVGYLNITVNDLLPTLSYSPNNLVLTRGLQSSDLPLNATLTGVGEITSWEINGTLPSGLNFGTNNGTIWGIPTVLQTSSVTYTIWANNSGGSSSATINITILEEIASIAYNPSSATIVRGYDMANISATKSGGIVVSWEISPSLPSGLSFDNGTIYGLPLVNMSSTIYTVYANNSGGSASASLTLTINEPTPNIDYNPDNYTMSNGSSYTITPVLLDKMNNPSGAVIGQPSSWSISQSLPSGLSFGTNNGTIWGTPTVLMNPTQYNITATNANGSSTTSINITINDVVPTLSYSPENLTLIKGLESIDLPLNAILTGSGVITSWEINGSLPTGLNFGTNNGTIWGIPTVLQTTATTYTIWANNSGGSTSATINITINDQVPLVSYSPENLTLLNNTVSTNLPLSPTLTGPGAITSWAIHPDLPTGLTFETSNGTIWGIATQRFTTTQYTVWANNSGGSSVANLNITVLHEVPMFTYTSYNLSLVNNTAMSVMQTTSTGGEIISWEVSPTIPPGLTFNVANGTLSGTPTVVQNMIMYTIWGNNTGGSHAVYLNITIYDPIVSLDYNPENETMTRGLAMTDMTPILSGIVDNWAIEPSLPSGLTFAGGVISGTPTVNMTQTMYTIWANNTGGSASHTINLTINEQIAVLDYNPENLTFIRNVAITNLHPTVTGGNVETWAIHPSIPLGLNFVDGVLSGTPTVNMTQTMYTIWANNTGGSASHTINLTINEPIVVLDYNPENLTMIRSNAMTALHPSVTGGNVETWAIYPSIPAGLNFADGVLSGTPTANMTRAMFTIYANTTGGSASHTINITILEPGVILDYNPENMTLTRGVAMATMTPTVTNGTAETWSINPLLPSGLSFNSGIISGTSSVNMTRTMFTVWANNSGGVAFHTVNLTILEPIVGLDYNPENLTLTRGVAMTALHPIVTGGNVSQWAIEPSPLSGLTFADGLLSGTPIVNQTTPIMYTIYANTTGGTITHTINISVLEPVVDLFYNPENQTLTRGEQSVAWLPTVSGGVPETWAIEPALPNGLIFENGTISGSPTVNSSTTQYTVWANNSGGPASTTINITINEPVPEIEYVPSDLVLTRGTTMVSLQPNVTGGAIASWEIEPTIPNGLIFVDGVISGTPTAIQNQTQYVVWANNSGGFLMAYLNITILDIIPEISYTPENITLTNDTSAIDWLPVNVGGPILTWSISPQLSEGLEFNQTTGHITGTPTEVTSLRTYLVTATNSGGSATTQINITVLDQVPMVAYAPDEVTLLNNSTVLSMEAIMTGGAVTSWSIVPDLSAGLFFDTTNGTLSGVATQVQGRTMYEITASNDVGSITVLVNITIEDLFYNMSLGPLYLLNNSEMVALEPELVISGSSFEIEPDLPDGLFFGADNGTIWGTPTELMHLTNFTIFANSSLFSDAFVAQVGVLEDTDLDGLPNYLPDDADPRRGLIEDLDDDDDGFDDLVEGDCLSDSLDNSDVPADFDGDLICNPIDDDVDGDGLNNTVETNTSTYVDTNNTGSDPWDADTDGDGICDGPSVPALPVDYCEAGPDAFPNDAAAYLDTDDDGMPDELWGESTTGLIEDLDDDDDNWTDLQEADCGSTDPKDEFDTPLDSDGDDICDFNDVLSVIYGTGDFELLQGQRNVSLQPIVTGMAVDIWEITPALPYGLFFGGDTMARTSNGNGTIYGVPLVPSNLTEYTVTATNVLIGTQISTTFNLSILEDYDLDGLPNNNTRLGLLDVDLDDDGDGFNDTFELECGGDPYNRSSVPKIESDGTCYTYRAYEEPPEKDKNPFKPICFPIIFLLLAFILVVPMILTRRNQRVGVRAEHVSGTPDIQSGSGTIDDPFVLKAVKIPYSTKGTTVERIRCAEMSPDYEITFTDTNVEVNKKRFGITQLGGVQDGTGVIKSTSDGLLMVQFTFDGRIEPSEYGMVYKSELVLDEKTYFVWHVETGARKGK